MAAAGGETRRREAQERAWAAGRLGNQECAWLPGKHSFKGVCDKKDAEGFTQSGRSRPVSRWDRREGDDGGTLLLSVNGESPVALLMLE